ASDRKDALAVSDELDDVAIDVRFARAGNAHRLVQRDIDMLFPGTERMTVDAHLITGPDLGAEHGGHAIARHASLLDPLIGLAARAGARLADIFVESHR